jgi:hypothetical protein
MRTSPTVAGGDRLTGLQAEMVADALDGGVAIGAGIFGEQLAGMQFACGITADHIGEGAATVDPEVPTAAHHPIPRFIGQGSHFDVSSINRR